MEKQPCIIGMVGLGVMGRNMVLNMADHGYSTVGYDKDISKVSALRKEAGSKKKVLGANHLEEFVSLLQVPRAVMMMVPAGAPVDSVIRDLTPFLKPGDLIIDGGNSYFRDTDARSKALAKNRLFYLGVGVSGGEFGARHGPSIMPGGQEDAYKRVQQIFEAIAAHVKNEPCVTYLGPGSAGHYVKMVHNGIEYGIMQLIAETYHLLKQGLGMTNDELSSLFTFWDKEELSGYLTEITGRIFLQVDDKTGKRLVDVILDEASQKGTGMWTSQEALSLHVPVPTIDAALTARNLSALKAERETASKILSGPDPAFKGDRKNLVLRLKDALYGTMIMTYAQGFSLLRAASREYGYRLGLGEIARIWEGGCIIRSALLDDIREAYRQAPDLPSLLQNPHLGQEVNARQGALRAIINISVELGIPLAAFMASMGYFDSYRRSWLPANLIQAQRDYFGSHTYQRVDEKGIFHTQWRND
jgi:6-phosphogluconate dehydrogenase